MLLSQLIKKAFSFNHTHEMFELLETEKSEFSNGAAPQFHSDAKPGADTAFMQSKIGSDDKFGEALDGNIQLMSQAFGLPDNSDVVKRKFKIGGNIRACLFYMNGMANTTMVNDYILRQSMTPFDTKIITGDLLDWYIENLLSVGEASKKDDIGEVLLSVMDGKSAVFVEGQNQAVVLDLRGFDHRSIGEPKTEKVVKGPHESFVESIRTNITQIRRIVRTPDLMCKFISMGGQNNLSCCVIYRRGVANQSLVDEVFKRINKVDINHIASEGVLEQLTEVRSYSFISQALSTERPDRTSSMVMQGHVAVLVDGSPYAMIVPITFDVMMTSAEDSYMRPPFRTLMMAIRYIGLFFTIFLPALYIALLSFHPGIMSSEIIDTILVSRRMISMSVQFEMVFLLLVFQFVREAGLRVPGVMGQSISVISALVMGQAAVSANIVSSVMLILVALVGLGAYTIPDYSLQFSTVYLQFAMIFVASMFGLLGICALSLLTIAYLSSLKSFGVPLLAPFAPKTYAVRSILATGKQAIQMRDVDYVNKQK